MAIEKDLKIEEMILNVMKEQNVTRERAVKLIEDSVRVTQKAKQEADGFTDTLANGIREADNAINDLGDSLKGLAWDEGLPVNQATEFTKEISDLQKELQGIKNQKGPMDKKALELQQKRIAQIQKDINKTRVGIIGATKGSKKLSSSFLLMGEGSQGFSSMWKAVGSKSPKQLKESAESAGKIGAQMKNWGSLLAASGKGFSGLGNLVGLLGKGLGGLSKLMAGPAGLGMIAVKAIWDMGMAADKFVKNANKAFAMVRGPDIMTGDIKKQFREFNNAVYDIGENVRTGLQPEQVREFFQAVYQAGTNIDRLTKGYGSYRDAVYMAAKASRTLGVEVPQAGTMMSDLLNNFRMQMKNIDTLFTQTAFNAQKAGVSTDKFWAAITNANASLSFYGVYLGNSAKMLEKFTKANTMGFDDASKLTTDLTQSFKNMSSENKAAFIALSGGVEATAAGISESVAALQSDRGKLMKDIEAKVAVMAVTTDKGEREALAKEISDMRTQSTGLLATIQMGQEAMQSKNAVAQAEYLAMNSKNAGAQIAQMLKLQLGNKGLKDVAQENIMLHKKVLESRGFDGDILLKMKSLSQQSYNELSELLGVSKTGNNASVNVMNSLETLATVNKEIKDLNSENKDISDQARKDIVDKLVNLQGMTKTDADNLLKAISQGPKVTQAVVTAIEQNSKKVDPTVIAGQLSATFEKSQEYDKAALEVAGQSMQEQEAQKKAAEKTFKGVLDQTLSYEEIAKMTEGGLSWQAASIGLAQKLNDAVFGIYKHLLKGKTPEEKAADDARKKAGFGGGLFGLGKKEVQAGALRDNFDKLSTQQSEANEASKKIKEITAKQAAYDKNTSEETKNTDKKNLKLAQDQLKAAEANIKDTERTITILTDQNEANQEAARILRMMNAGNEKQAGEQIAMLLEQGKSWDEIGSQLSMSDTEMVRYLKTAGEEKRVPAHLKGLVTETLSLGIGTGTPETPPPAPKAGLIGSYQVKRQSENLLLHRGETVIGAQQGGGKSISITVNATETDLAKKIANEIQAALYQAKMV